ncbi:oxidoreductase [Promicromonospora thailandica]|uniref:2-dehydropantoate 2-reductase n=1 Tax=Promicromonospora thailandica TaxID=765201 RepID=A0A9X2G324_9MICO|nr:oxidoreductase [Promicromonospora thailandica]MCP2265979.1 ketopantoate reductase (EC 1.1.1.169) [Promicromonospora thailandica]BFF21439.1 oxidoreductase [Promicromonospora thailandica]
MTSEKPDVAVVGPGAIGTTVAAALHEAGRTPRLYGRTPRERVELRVGPPGADERVEVPGPVLTDPDAVAGVVDLVFLAVKATQVDDAAPWLAALCGPGTVVCVLQNGVEQAATVGPHVPRGAVVPAVVWFPAWTQDDGVVHAPGEVRLTLPDVPAAGPVVDALRGTRCDVDVSPDFVTAAWRKLLQNAVAGLMALTGRRSAVFTRPDVADLALAYLGEGLAVARAEGARLDDDVPGRILALFQRPPGDQGTSILTDRDAGRPLEWAVRNGVVSRRGRAHGIPTPVSDLVVTLLAATSDGPG